MPTATQFFTAANTAMRLMRDLEEDAVVTRASSLNATQQLRLADAMALWSDISEFRAFSADDDAARARHTVTWLGTHWQSTLANDWTRVAVGDISGSNVLGINKSWGAGRHYHEVFIDTSNEGLSTFQLGSRAFETLLHELGYSVLGAHGVGDALNDAFSVMVPYQSNDPQVWYAATPMFLDIYTAINLYGETSTRTGNDTYGFNARFSGGYRAALDFNVNTRPLVTIYDSGGNDTLNASGFVDAYGTPRPVHLDLNQGIYHPSSMLDGGRQIFAFIYETTWIENAVGGFRDDEIIGNSRANRLSAGGGDDVISGEGGADLIEGGLGSDTMTGGDQSDTFIFKRLAHSRPGEDVPDIIMDFKTSGADRIDVSLIDANGAGPGHTLTFLATAGAAFTAPGQIRWYQYGGYTYVEASTDGDSAAEFAIKLAGSKTLSAGDFVL